MKLGAFSISLSVKNIHKSKQFYETLGFSIFAGDLERKYAGRAFRRDVRKEHANF